MPAIYSSGNKPPPEFAVRDLNGPKLQKDRVGPLSKLAQVAIHPNLCGKPLKLPRASTTMRSKVRVTFLRGKKKQQNAYPPKHHYCSHNCEGPIPMC
jgi:hypothetical protein